MPQGENRRIRKNINVLFSFIVASILFLLGMTNFNLYKTRAKNYEQETASKRNELLDSISNNIQEMNIALEKYHLTKKPDFISNYKTNYNSINKSLESINTYSIDSDVLIKLAGQLKSEITKKQSIDLDINNNYDSSKNNNIAFQTFKRKESTYNSQKIHQLINELYVKTDYVLNTHAIEESAIANKTMLLLLITSLVFLSVLFVAFYIIRRDLIRLNMSENSLKKFLIKISSELEAYK